MSQDEERVAPGFDPEAKRIKFDYIKSNYFRVVHVDGIFGGNSPGHALITMAVWNERWPIPKQSVYGLQKDGSLGEEIVEDRVTRNAVVREVETELIMTIETAKVMRDWLDERIVIFEKQIEEYQAKEPQH
jgi:hypothetical protein